jgi:alkyl hydroperoxide reductase subunit F
MYDLIVLGGGPAGLTAAVYAIRKRLEVLLISPDLGGKTNWQMQLPDDLGRFQAITGDDVVSRFKSESAYLEHARKLEHGELVKQVEGGFGVTTREGNLYETRAVIVATGANARRLNVPGETQYRLRGLAYSATSYAPLFIDRTVAVVGEGEQGVWSALELAQNSRHVYFIVSSPDVLNTALGQKIEAANNVTVFKGCAVKEVTGDEEYARRIIVARGVEEFELDVDVTFVELDLLPNSDCVADLVQLNDKKQIVVDSNNHTSQAGILAAGDVSNVHAGQVLICVGEGAKAALSAYKYLLTL